MCHTSVCCKCFKFGKITKHHLLPKRFFGTNDKILYLCATCHREIEAILPRGRKLTKQEYRDIHQDWLRGHHVIVTERMNSDEKLYKRASLSNIGNHDSDYVSLSIHPAGNRVHP